ncbi:ankyrin repeat family A protein 2 isoform X2 [Patella vulgata]|uniref:ankyrin repeat family A protein 2 isoform X2 n=1 Tax=Patella vulgata TaxID=6465 RepID=UPI00217F4A01|nr:ankyrin repeat family A protein 2 isoform X2 [Patella vulgata]
MNQQMDRNPSTSKPSPDKCRRMISPVKRRSSSSGGRFFSPVDYSDQELNDLEVENVFGDADDSFHGSSDADSSPTKPRRHETPSKINYSPFRPSTVMSNLQRGNVQTTTPSIIQNMSIHQMAAQGELVLLQQEIKDGCDMNKTDESGFTALLWACANGQMSSVEYLLQNGADINLIGNHGENALLLSSCYGYSDIMLELLKLGMDINYKDESGSSALIYAAFNNHTSCIQLLLEWGADITITNEDNHTAYDLAVGQGHKAAQQVIERHMLQMFESPT